MTKTINSRVLGKEITFSRPGNSYIYADLNGQPGTLGNQLTKTGGSTIAYIGENEKVFSRICQNWYNLYIKDYRRYN